jgi:hypothetical protein
MRRGLQQGAPPNYPDYPAESRSRHSSGTDMKNRISMEDAARAVLGRERDWACVLAVQYATKKTLQNA